MYRRTEKRPQTLPMWERVKSGEWQYGRGLALAWTGARNAACAEFEAAAEKFRLRGAAEMLARVTLHLRLLELRSEADAGRRSLLAARLAARLNELRQVEDYHPPFAVVSGSRMAQDLWRDILREDFLLAGEEPELARDRLAG